MEKMLFEYRDYKAYILDRIADAPNLGRGLRRKLALAIGCQVAYVSHVLAGNRDFSLEQAEAISRFFDLREDETEYFLNLLEFNRAGTQNLKNLFERRLNKLQQNHNEIKNRVGIQVEISTEDQAFYYSSWHFQAIRMIITIPQFRTSQSISKKLGISQDRVNEVLSFLLNRGLIKDQGNYYVTTDSTIHLGSDSPLISKLHTNWRIHTLKSLDRIKADDFHYSACVTLSEQDYQKVREILMKSLVKTHEVIKPSEEERLCVMALDFYEI